jgi:hypothetical protein
MRFADASPIPDPAPVISTAGEFEIVGMGCCTC